MWNEPPNWKKIYEDLSLRENIQFNQDKNIDNNTKDQNIEKNINARDAKILTIVKNATRKIKRPTNTNFI